MDLVMFQYIEINTIGIVILSTILLYIVKIQRDFIKEGQSFFVKMLVCNIVILLSDIVIYLMRWHSSPFLIATNNLVCMLYFIMHAYFGYLWLRFSIVKLYPEYNIPIGIKFLIQLPCFINAVLVVTSPFTNWIYYLTEQNRYFRGDFIWISMALSYLYWFIGAALTLKELLKSKGKQKRPIFITLLCFPIPTLIGNIVQAEIYGVSIVWICSAISILILFINLQNYHLSHNTLTGLYNRLQTHNRLLWEIKHLDSDSDYLFFMMIDVDHFKEINDCFGHIEGDHTLKKVAEILKNGCRENDFIGRIGGDEFVVIGHAKSKEEVKVRINEIQRQAQIYSDTLEKFILSLSIGYKLYKQSDSLSVNSIIAAADEEMYKIKKTKQNLSIIK